MDQQLATLYFLKQLEEAFRQSILLFKIANITLDQRFLTCGPGIREGHKVLTHIGYYCMCYPNKKYLVHIYIYLFIMNLFSQKFKDIE